MDARGGDAHMIPHSENRGKRIISSKLALVTCCEIVSKKERIWVGGGGQTHRKIDY